MTRYTDAVEADQLEAGDTYETPGGHLVVLGVLPESEAPESAGDGALYECRLTEGPASNVHLYRPHNITTGVEAGAEYVGRADDVEERDPFYCDNCEIPHREADRYEHYLIDGEFCGRGCARSADTERRKDKMARRTGAEQ